MVKFALLSLLLLLPACSEKEVAYTLPLGEERVIRVQLDDARFTPSMIQALHGDRLLLQVYNTESKTHYLTVKNPRGDFIRSVVLPAGETVQIPLLLTDEGVWRFYGEKPLQESNGMQGSITAVARN
ncbi:MAG: hypothetical protein R2940_08035 [Syntrophotaleaceae bacterium]